METIEDAMLAVKDAVARTKKEQSKEAEKDVRQKATDATKLAVSQYIKELEKKFGNIPNIAKEMYKIDMLVANKEATPGSAPSFERDLNNWKNKRREISLHNLYLLKQVGDATYDHILGLDKSHLADRLTYGYLLEFFFHLFRYEKIGIFKYSLPDGLDPVDFFTFNKSFEMTQYFYFIDNDLCDISGVLNEAMQNGDMEKYDRTFQRYVDINKYRLLAPETSEADMYGDRPSPLDDAHAQHPKGDCPDPLKGLGGRLRSLSKKHLKNQSEFCKDVCIPSSSFSDWTKGKSSPRPNNLLLIAMSLDLSVDSILSPNTSSSISTASSYKYTYGNTLPFIKRLMEAGIISQTEKKPFSNDQISFPAGVYKINDFFLIRLIAEMEYEMSSSSDLLKDGSTHQIIYEESLSAVRKLIDKYENEDILCYNGYAGGCLVPVVKKKWLVGTQIDMHSDPHEVLKTHRECLRSFKECFGE